MTTEELLYPRYKVIERWPDMGVSGYHAGQIVTLMQKDGGQWCKKERDLTTYEAFFEGYPHLFQRLEWWQERKPDDMPQYVKCLLFDFKFKKGEIIKVAKWLESFGPTLRFYPDCTDKITLHPHVYEPATEADYNAYLQTTNQNIK